MDSGLSSRLALSRIIRNPLRKRGKFEYSPSLTRRVTMRGVLGKIAVTPLNQTIYKNKCEVHELSGLWGGFHFRRMILEPRVGAGNAFAQRNAVMPSEVMDTSDIE